VKAASTEFELTVECCRGAFAGGDAGKVRELSERVDWDRFLRLARFHRVQGLVLDCLRSTEGKIPPEISDVLASDTESILAANLRIAAECGVLRSDFEKAGIELMFVKGLTVGALAYRKPLLKMGWDIDLLVGPDRVTNAVELLRDRGYQQVVPAQGVHLQSWHRRRKESVWTRDPGLHVELHTRLADNPRLIPTITVDSPRQLVEVMPGTSLPTLAGEELFAYLCVHGASSAWFRLKWISDIAGVIAHLPPAEVERLYARSQDLGAGRAAGQALLLADRLFELLAESPLRTELPADGAARRLAKAAFRQLAGRAEPREPTAIPLGTARIHWTQLLLKPGLGFKLSELSRQIRDAVA